MHRQSFGFYLLILALAGCSVATDPAPPNAPILSVNGPKVCVLNAIDTFTAVTARALSEPHHYNWIFDDTVYYINNVPTSTHTFHTLGRHSFVAQILNDNTNEVILEGRDTVEVIGGLSIISPSTPIPLYFATGFRAVPLALDPNHSYTWRWSIDGASDTESRAQDTVSLIFRHPGIRTISVWLHDDTKKELIGFASTKIFVDPFAVGVAVSSPNPQPLDSVGFSLTSLPANLGPFTVLWSFGDGSTIRTSTTTVQHAYFISGKLAVTAQLFDTSNALIGFGSTSVQVSPPPSVDLALLHTMTHCTVELNGHVISTDHGNCVSSAYDPTWNRLDLQLSWSADSFRVEGSTRSTTDTSWISGSHHGYDYYTYSFNGLIRHDGSLSGLNAAKGRHQYDEWIDRLYGSDHYWETWDRLALTISNLPVLSNSSAKVVYGGYGSSLGSLVQVSGESGIGSDETGGCSNKIDSVAWYDPTSIPYILVTFSK